MADYTIRLCDLIKREHYPLVETAMSTYEAPSPEVRDELNQYILQHYWLREIGQETGDIFAHYLKRALDEMMPIYNRKRTIEAYAHDLDPAISYSEIVETTRNESRNGKNSNTRTYNGTTSNTHSVEDSSTSDNTVSNNGKTTQSGTTTNSSTVDVTDSSNTTQDTTGSNTSDGYNKDYAIPMTGGSSGTGPGGFSDDFASGGSVNHSNDSTTGKVTTVGSNTGKTTTSGEATNNGTTSTEGGATSKTTTSGTSTATDNGTSGGDDTTNGTSESATQGTETIKRNGTNAAVWRNVQEYLDSVRDINTEMVNDPRLRNLFFASASLWTDEWGVCL